MDAQGTISANGATITLSANGTSYTGKPQIVVSGSGWRYSDDSSRDNETLSSSSGLIIDRETASGHEAFMKASIHFIDFDYIFDSARL